MNVLYICHDATLYGSSKSLLDLMDALQKYQVKPHVIIPYAGPLEKELIQRRIKYKVIKYANNFRIIGERHILKENLNEIKNILVVKQLITLVREWSIDVIHTNNLCSDVGAMTALITKVPHIWHIREFMEEDFHYELYRKRKMKYLLNKADAIILISKAIYKKYCRLYSKERMKVIYDLISFEDYNQSKEEFYESPELNLLLSGAIIEGKGQLEAVKAVNYLRQQGICNIRLFLAGRGRDEEVARIKKFMKEHQLSGVVTFCGFKNSLKEIRKKADLALVCSKSEGLGRVTIESMLSDLPVIGSNTAATKELISHGITGYLYKSGDYIDLADKIKYAMEHKEEVKHLKKTAKEYAMRTFTTKASVEEVHKLYEDVRKNSSFK